MSCERSEAISSHCRRFTLTCPLSSRERNLRDPENPLSPGGLRRELSRTERVRVRGNVWARERHGEIAASGQVGTRNDTFMSTPAEAGVQVSWNLMGVAWIPAQGG